MPQNPRVTVTLDIFDDKVIDQMSKHRDASKSEMIRFMVRQWIEENPNMLEKNYGVNIDDINKEIAAKSKGITPEHLIDKLPSMFNSIERISINELADFLDVDQKTIKNIIFQHGEELKEKGLTLKYIEGVIVKK